MTECSETRHRAVPPQVLALLTEASSKLLKSLLLSIPGTKFLLVDPELIVCLDYVIKIADLKNCGVEKIFRLNRDDPPPQVNGCVYLVKSTTENAMIISDQVNAKPKKCSVIFVPEKTYVCEKILEREGVYEHVTIHEYAMGFLAVDSDLLSLELQDFYPLFFLHNDQSYIHAIAKALVQLQNVCGVIPLIQGHGRATEKIYDVMVSMFQESTVKRENPFISHLFLFDRDIDYVSVLLSQLNCEGLLDETFNVKTGRLTVEKEIAGLNYDVKLNLNDTDMIFKEIRNVHISQVFSKLKEITNQLKLQENLKTNLTISSMKQIVAHKIKTAPQENLLPVYMSIFEKIVKERQKKNFGKQLNVEGSLLYLCTIEGYSLKDVILFIENAICKQDSMYTILRLMCLLSITHDGIPAVHYKHLCDEFMKSYGHKHLVTFHNLKKLGICTEQAPFYRSLSMAASGSAGRLAEKVVAAVTSLPKQSSFATIVKKMTLVSSNSNGVNLKSPSNMSYVFNGTYIPLVGQLMEKLLDHKFEQVQEVLKLLPGKTIDTSFSISEHQPNDRHKPWIISPSGTLFAQGESSKRIVIVFLLGGITCAEVAALRLWSQLKGLYLIVATTSIINGNSLMKLVSPF